MLNLLSWNIQQGGGSRTTVILKAIIEQRSEVVILSEFRNNKNGNLIRNTMLDYGYRYQIVSHAEKEENSVAIFSKLPCASKLYQHETIDYSANVVMADLGMIRICGVYLPHKKKHKLFDILHQEATADIPLIIAGDFNTGINGIDQNGTSFWYTDELKQLSQLEMVDAFRVLHGDQKEYSWYSHQGNGYRYDHTYISKVMAPIISKCDYLHSWREEKLSDHSPMLLSIE